MGGKAMSATVEEYVLSQRGADYIVATLREYGVIKKMVESRKAAAKIVKNLIGVIPMEVRQSNLFKEETRATFLLEGLKKDIFVEILVLLKMNKDLPDKKTDFIAWWNDLSCKINPALRNHDSELRTKINNNKEAKEKLRQVAFLSSVCEFLAHL